MSRLTRTLPFLFLILLAWTSLMLPLAADQFGDFTYTKSSSAITITDYTGAGGAVTIPDTIAGLPVRTIKEEAFFNKTNLTSVTIPNGVTSIGDYAFSYCWSLASVTIPNSVTSIGDSAFYSCESLTSVTIPASVTRIKDSAFQYCRGLTSVTLFANITSIGNSVFSYCVSLASITIPNSVTSIGDSAFSSCRSLTSVTIPASVTSIADSAFTFCYGLLALEVAAGNAAYRSENGVLFNNNQTKLVQYPAGKTGGYTIPSTVTSIGDHAFHECMSLTSVAIPASVASIGMFAFAGCNSLTSVAIPEGVTSIGFCAFYYCTSLTSVTIPASATSIAGFAFSGCENLPTIEVATGNPAYRSVNGVLFNNDQTELVQYPSGKIGGYTIPGGVTTIGGAAFYGTGLTSVAIPASVTTIGNSAFRVCDNLTSVIIPASVTSIELQAFQYCSGLASVTFEGNAPASFGADIFGSAASGFTIYYYEGSTGFTSPTWNDYPAVALPRTAPDPPLVIHSLSRGAGTFSAVVAGQAGRTYTLQRKPGLAEANWSPVATAGPLGVDTPSLTLTDPAAPSGQAFYRVIRSGP